MIDTVIAKDFKIVKKLGSGSFGEVFMALHLKTKDQYAVKLETIGNKSPQLFYEAKILNNLGSGVSNITDYGISQVYYCSNESEYNIMVMDLLGDSLEDKFISNGRKFSMKAIFYIGQQMLERIEYIHDKKYVHRDIKPDNFVFGRGKEAGKIFVIDFGLAKKYIQRDNVHIPYKDNKNLTGTARYTSLNTHLGIEQGRRDDIEGIAHVLIYFAKGYLPWQNLKANGKKQKYEKIMDKKLSITPAKLCSDIPEEFKQLLNYSRNLEFEDRPNYEFLKKMFEDAYNREAYELSFTHQWII